MANDIVSGLFGLSPREVQQQQQNQLNAYSQDVASYAPKGFELASLLGGRAGAGLANIGAGMMGMVNPEVEAAKQREAVLSQADLQTPEGILKAAEAARQRGDVRMQIQLQMLARQRAAEQQKLASEQQEAEQVGMVRSTEMAKNLAQAQKATREEESAKTKYSSYAQQLIDEGITPGTPEFTSRMREYNIREEQGKGKGSGGGGESIQPIPYIDPATGKAVWGTIKEARGKPAAAFDPVTKQIVAEAVSEGTVKGKDVAMIGGKYDALDAISSAQGLLEKGIYTGGYATAGKAIAKYTPGMDKTKVANTEEFLSHIGNVVIPRLQEFGGNDSVEELKYLRAVSAGDITLEKESIKKILSAAERKINAGIRRVAKGKQQTSGGGLSIEERLSKY